GAAGPGAAARAGGRQARFGRARDEVKSAPLNTEGEAMAAASEQMAPLAEALEEAAPEEKAAPDAPSPAAIAAEPIALEPAEDAPTAAAAGEAAIELAQLESTSASH